MMTKLHLQASNIALEGQIKVADENITQHEIEHDEEITQRKIKETPNIEDMVQEADSSL